ncbi:MAG: hypothetical protein NTZ78_04860, partial [Candidatus Aureabacteria bacterium]|nr:hypothetical protein [Candidatus Auribacterota bacterium]
LYFSSGLNFLFSISPPPFYAKILPSMEARFIQIQEPEKVQFSLNHYKLSHIPAFKRGFNERGHTLVPRLDVEEKAPGEAAWT